MTVFNGTRPRLGIRQAECGIDIFHGEIVTWRPNAKIEYITCKLDMVSLEEGGRGRLLNYWTGRAGFPCKSGALLTVNNSQRCILWRSCKLNCQKTIGRKTPSKSNPLLRANSISLKLRTATYHNGVTAAVAKAITQNIGMGADVLDAESIDAGYRDRNRSVNLLKHGPSVSIRTYTDKYRRLDQTEQELLDCAKRCRQHPQVIPGIDESRKRDE